MKYTKGERSIYCADDYWMVEVKDRSSLCIIGKFHTKDDALLDAAAPAMYEALESIIDVWINGGTVPTIVYRNAEQAIRKAAG